MKFLRQGFQKLEHKQDTHTQTDTQTDKRDETKGIATAALATGKNYQNKVMPGVFSFFSLRLPWPQWLGYPARSVLRPDQSDPMRVCLPFYPFNF